MNTSKSTENSEPVFEKRGVVEVGITPSERSSKPSEKIESEQALCKNEEPVKDIVKEAAKLF